MELFLLAIAIVACSGLGTLLTFLIAIKLNLLPGVTTKDFYNLFKF